MAGNIYLFLDGIPGESTAVNFINWIDVASFSIGAAMEVDQEARTGSGGGTSGAADPEDCSCDKKMDWATPMLLQCCAAGAIIPKARLFQCNVVNEIVLPVSSYAFGDVIITSCNLSGSGGGIPDESLTFCYGSICWKYHCYSHSNPSSEVGNYHKEWSIISANPKKADPNAIDALALSMGEAYTASGSAPFSEMKPVSGTGPV